MDWVIKNTLKSSANVTLLRYSFFKITKNYNIWKTLDTNELVYLRNADCLYEKFLIQFGIMGKLQQEEDGPILFALDFFKKIGY